MIDRIATWYHSLAGRLIVGLGLLIVGSVSTSLVAVGAFRSARRESASSLQGQALWSDAVARFESIYSPELVGGDVIFTDYEFVAANRD